MSGALIGAQRILERLAPGLEGNEQERAVLLALDVPGGPSLEGINGLGPAQQARLLAVFEIVRRLSMQRTPVIADASSVRHRREELPDRALKRIPPELRSASKEWLGFVPIYRTGEVGALCVVENGVRTHVNVEPAELFSRVLALRPAGFVLVHNHPSGDLRPSTADRELTARVAELGARLQILLLGHWVVTTRSARWLEARA